MYEYETYDDKNIWPWIILRWNIENIRRRMKEEDKMYDHETYKI